MIAARWRRYLITGSTGIGAATARLLASGGQRVFVISRTSAHVAALVDDLAHAGGDASGTAADLQIEQEAVAAVRDAHARLGRIDGVFNVAGMSGRRFGDGPLHEVTLSGWDITLGSNLTSMFLVCRETLGILVAQAPDEDGARGAILNMGSVLAAHPSSPQFATHAYAAAKGAIVSMSRAMAATYAPRGIRVNVIAPRLTRTPMSRRAQDDPDILDFASRRQPLVGGMLSAEDIARTAAFLLGPNARAITGDVITIDGGWSVSA